MPREEFPRCTTREQGGDRSDGGEREREKKKSHQNQRCRYGDCCAENSLLFSAVRRDDLIILLRITGTHNRRLLAAFME